MRKLSIGYRTGFQGVQVLLATFFLLLAQAAFAEELRGHVVGITDGDTLALLTEQWEEVRIRLAAIDRPEGGQLYGSRAREMLSDLTFGKIVRVAVQDTDHYGRKVGRVYGGTMDVNAEMVRRGAAWVFSSSLDSREFFIEPQLNR